MKKPKVESDCQLSSPYDSTILPSITGQENLRNNLKEELPSVDVV